MSLGNRPGIRGAHVSRPFRAGVRSDHRRSLLRTWANWPGAGLARLRPTPGSRDSLAPILLPGLPVRRPLGLAVPRSQGDLELDDFIPLRISAIALGDGQKFAEPTTRILGRGLVHGDIMTHREVVVQQE